MYKRKWEVIKFQFVHESRAGIATGKIYVAVNSLVLRADDYIIAKTVAFLCPFKATQVLPNVTIPTVRCNRLYCSKTGNLGELSLNRFTMPLTATARHVGFVMD